MDLKKRSEEQLTLCVPFCCLETGDRAENATKQVC